MFSLHSNFLKLIFRSLESLGSRFGTYAHLFHPNPANPVDLLFTWWQFLSKSAPYTTSRYWKAGSKFQTSQVWSSIEADSFLDLGTEIWLLGMSLYINQNFLRLRFDCCILRLSSWIWTRRQMAVFWVLSITSPQRPRCIKKTPNRRIWRCSFPTFTNKCATFFKNLINKFLYLHFPYPLMVSAVLTHVVSMCRSLPFTAPLSTNN